MTWSSRFRRWHSFDLFHYLHHLLEIVQTSVPARGDAHRSLRCSCLRLCLWRHGDGRKGSLESSRRPSLICIFEVVRTVVGCRNIWSMCLYGKMCYCCSFLSALSPLSLSSNTWWGHFPFLLSFHVMVVTVCLWLVVGRQGHWIEIYSRQTFYCIPSVMVGLRSLDWDLLTSSFLLYFLCNDLWGDGVN